MKIRTLSQLYVESLKQLCTCEYLLIETLPKMIEAASSNELKQAISDHLLETKDQGKRLISILHDLDENPHGPKCHGLEGMLKDIDERMSDIRDPFILDIALVGSLQQIENFEFSAYGSVRALAMMMGIKEHVSVLELTLEEEYCAEERLGEIARDMLNVPSLTIMDMVDFEVAIKGAN